PLRRDCDLREGPGSSARDHPRPGAFLSHPQVWRERLYPAGDGERSFDGVERAPEILVGMSIVDVPVMVRLNEQPPSYTLRVKAGATILVERIAPVEREKRHRWNTGHRDRLTGRPRHPAQQLQETAAALPKVLGNAVAAKNFERLQRRYDLQAVRKKCRADERLFLHHLHEIAPPHH